MRLGVTLIDFADSTAPRDTIAAYLAARYRFWGRLPVALTIGTVNRDFARLLCEQGVASAAVITAWNPLGVVLAKAVNDAAQARLIAALDALGLAHDPGQGEDPAGIWTPEDSRLVFGADLETAATLGREFDQNAVVWAGADAVPRLVMLQ